MLYEGWSRDALLALVSDFDREIQDWNAVLGSMEDHGQTDGDEVDDLWDCLEEAKEKRKEAFKALRSI